MHFSRETKFIYILLIILAHASISYSQGISFLNDYLGNVSVFDNGEIKQIESHPLKSYKIGNKILAYEDNTGNIKIYYNRYSFKINSFANDYLVSNNLALVRMNRQIKVFDNGQIKDLSSNTRNYFLGENLVVWFDDFNKMLRAYYEKEVYDLDDGLTGDSGKDQNTEGRNEVKIGKNIASFVSNQGITNVFYKGDIEELGQKDRIKNISVGKDIIAYIEEPINILKAYYFGEIIEIDNFEPKSLFAGDEMLAFLDSNNYLKVFYNNQTQILSYEAPSSYKVKDKIIVFCVQNYFKLWYNNKIFTLESGFIPEDYKIDNNSLAYLDRYGNLKLFDGTGVKTISYEKVKDYEIYGNLVKYSYGVNSEQIYYNGKTYKNY